MALTLSEAKKHSTNIQERAIVTELAAGPLLGALPFRDVSGNGLFGKREESLGDVGFRGFNDAYTETYATVKQHSEALKLFGGDIKVDRAIMELEGLFRGLEWRGWFHATIAVTRTDGRHHHRHFFCLL